MNRPVKAIAAAMRVAGLAFALVASASPGRASEAAAIFGRWATDPADCADNRYVWVFAEERAGLVVNNAPLGGWRRPAYRKDDGGVTVAFAGPPAREIAWRIVKEGEMVTIAHRENGRPIEERSFLPWRRCPN